MEVDAFKDNPSKRVKASMTKESQHEKDQTQRDKANFSTATTDSNTHRSNSPASLLPRDLAKMTSKPIQKEKVNQRNGAIFAACLLPSVVSM